MSAYGRVDHQKQNRTASVYGLCGLVFRVQLDCCRKITRPSKASAGQLTVVTSERETKPLPLTSIDVQISFLRSVSSGSRPKGSLEFISVQSIWLMAASDLFSVWTLLGLSEGLIDDQASV